MKTFQSIVLFDTETTSNPSLDHNTTKITELAFIACETEHIKNANEIPRVLHKLVLCFHPFKMIQPKVTEISGLDNEMLCNLKPFSKKDVEMLNNFISRLPPPVCIVAHNGNKFDFPILGRILKKLECNLSNEIYCADSYIGFRNIYKNEETSASELFQANDSTPKKQKTVPVNHLNYKKNHDVISEEKTVLTPEVRRELFPDETNVSFLTFNKPISFSLKNIYSFLHNRNFPNAHRAENDSEALLSCIVKCKRFLEWMNENAVPFNSIQPLV